MTPGLPQPDEDKLALLGLHPAQMAVAHGLASGAIHPQAVLDAASAPPPQPAASEPSSQPNLIASPPSPGVISAPPVGSTAQLEQRADQPKSPPGPVVPSKLDTDQAELQRLQKTGSGIDQFRQKHPVLGTIAKIATGVGESLFPGIAANIPGTDVHHQVLENETGRNVAGDLATEKEQAGQEETEARTGEIKQQTENLAHPEAKPTEETWKVVPGMVDPTGKVLQESNKGNVRWAPGIQGAGPLREPNQQKPDSIDQQYADAIASHDHAAAARLLKVKEDMAKAGQAPQREPRQLAIGPDGKVIELTPGATVPQGTKSVSNELGKPSADETRRADLAENMNENLNQLEDILKRRPELFGPIAGRVTGLKGMIGTSDPDVAALKTLEEQIGMAMVGAHAMRNAQHVETAANSLVNALHNEPKAIEGAISAARKSLKTFTGDAARKEGSQPATKEKPADNDPLGIR
jgi:hypothetical protein